VLSGLIVDNLSWRWLFIAGAVPIGVSILLVHRFVPESPIKTASRLDVPGATLLSAGLVCLLVALTEGETWGWTSPGVGGLGAAAVALLVAWVLAELRVPEPMVDMRMMASRQVLLTNITALIAGFAMFGAWVLIPNFVESSKGLVHYGFDASATVAGLYLLPSSFTLLFAGPLAGLIARRTGSKWPLAIGLFIVSATTAWIARWHDEPWQMLAAMPALGIGVGFAFASMATLIAENVRPVETGVATGVNTVMRSIGGVIGGQAGAAFLSAYTLDGTSVPAETGFTITVAIGAGAALVGAGLACLVPEPRRLRSAPLQV
jgi:MFS family permease